MNQQDDQLLATDTEQPDDGCDTIEPLSDDELEEVAGGWDGTTPPNPNGGG